MEFTLLDMQKTDVKYQAENKSDTGWSWKTSIQFDATTCFLKAHRGF